MAFNNKNDDSAMSEINVTPLVDVMLVLLIIFIVTAPLLTQSINVNLPETVKTNSVADNPEDHIVTVELNPQGHLTFTKKEIKQLELRSSEEGKIAQAFEDLLKADKEVILAFSVDTTVPHGEVMKIIASAQKVGILRLSFLTTEEK